MPEQPISISLEEALGGEGLSCDAPIVCVECTEGQAVEILARKAKKAMGDAGAKARVLVVSPNRNGKLSFVNRWRRLFGANAVLPRVQTIEEVCLFVLDQTNAIESFGRKPRVLNCLEEKVLLEDMKTLGIQERRLKGMLSFFEKSIADMVDKDPSWLVNDEERMVFAALRSCLLERGAMLSCELGNIAMASMEAGVPRACQADYVFVLGYTSLSSSMQALCRKLAVKQTVATGLVRDPGVANIAYPNPHGLGDLVQGGEAEGFIIKDCSTLAPVIVSLQTPTDEGFAVWQLAKGASEGGSGYTMIIAPNSAWQRRMRGACEDGALNAQSVAQPKLCKGDPRKTDHDPHLSIYAALGILADPSDVVAWRTWIGLGDWLCLSDAWKELRVLAESRASGIGECIADVLGGKPLFVEGHGAGPSSLAKLEGRLIAGRRLIEDCCGLKGRRLLEAVAAAVGFDGDLDEYFDVPVSENDDATLLFRRIHDASRDPMPTCQTNAIVVTPQSGRYLTSDITIITGLVEGFLPRMVSVDDSIPPAKREKPLEFDRKMFEACTRTPERTLVFTSFEEMGLESATILGADIDRIRFAEGKRMAGVKRSRFADDAEEIDRESLIGEVYGKCWKAER